MGNMITEVIQQLDPLIDLLKKQSNEPNPSAIEDDETMKELRRIMLMKNGSDWQQVSRELKTFTRRIVTEQKRKTIIEGGGSKYNLKD